MELRDVGLDVERASQSPRTLLILQRDLLIRITAIRTQAATKRTVACPLTSKKKANQSCLVPPRATTLFSAAQVSHSRRCPTCGTTLRPSVETVTLYLERILKAPQAHNHRFQFRNYQTQICLRACAAKHKFSATSRLSTGLAPSSRQARPMTQA